MSAKSHSKLDLEAACALESNGRGVTTIEAAFEILARSMERDNSSDDDDGSVTVLGVEAWLQRWNAPRDS